MRRPTFALLLLGAASVISAGCADMGDPVGIDATGEVHGLAWLDRNGAGELDISDGPVSDVTVHLTARHGSTPLFSATSNASGEFVFPEVPVGDYRAVVDESSVGDSIQVLRIDSADVTVAAGEASLVIVGFSFPAVAIDSARQAPVDSRLFIEGLVLNSWGTFADSTVHIRDSTGAIRGVRVQPMPVTPGDSIRMLGTVRTRSGQPVLQDVSAFMLRTGSESPEPETVEAEDARFADDGRLDAALVRLDSAVVRDTTRNSLGELVFTVEDASGTADVLLDRDINFQLNFPTVIIGAILEVTGLLVPTSTAGEWVLKPRGSSDIVVGPLSFPTMPVDDAREEEDETRLIVKGRALNAWSTFGDSTVHVRDATGAIRSIRVPQSSIQAGDSVQVLGTIATLLGQPVLRLVHTTLLDAAVGSPAGHPVETASAASAAGGSLDADLVHVTNAVIQDTARSPEQDLVLIVDDGSGPVSILLDRHVPFGLDWPKENGESQVIGTRIDATGVLLPRAQVTGEWLMKPRRSADVELSSGG